MTRACTIQHNKTSCMYAWIYRIYRIKASFIRRISVASKAIQTVDDDVSAH